MRRNYNSMGKCGVVPGFFGVAVQGSLLAVCVATLATKYFYFERLKVDAERRSAARFLFDSSKQVAGSMLVHIMNLALSEFLSTHLSRQNSDECMWYFVEIMVDTTLGVYVEFRLVHLVYEVLRRFFDPSFLEQGCVSERTSDGGQLLFDRPVPATQLPLHLQSALTVPYLGFVLWKVYLLQLLHWLIVVACMKFVMSGFIVVFSPQLLIFGEVLDPLDSHARLKLVFVMLLTPTIMNGVQFWLQDNIFVSLSTKHDELEAVEHGLAGGGVPEELPQPAVEPPPAVAVSSASEAEKLRHATAQMRRDYNRELSRLRTERNSWRYEAYRQRSFAEAILWADIRASQRAANFERRDRFLPSVPFPPTGVHF